MTWEDKHIKSLFDDSLKKKSFTPGDREWKDLEKKILKKGFFDVGFRHFNIYWTVFIVSIIIALFFIFRIKMDNTEDKGNVHDEIIIPDTSNAHGKNNAYYRDTVNTTPKRIIQKPFKDAVKYSSIDTLNTEEEIGDTIKTDTSLNAKENKVIQNTQVIRKKKKVKKVLIIEQDDIYVQDSLNKEKGGLFKKKNN